MRAPSTTRILMYGLDSDLQTTREMLLKQAGYTTDTVDDWLAFTSHLGHGKGEYRLAVLCHTVPKDQRQECQRLARDQKIRVFALSTAVAPDDFIQQIAEMVSA